MANALGKFGDAEDAAPGRIPLVSFTGDEGKNRLLPSLATTYARATNGATWLKPTGPTEIYITVRPTAAFTNEKKASVVFNSSTELEASTAFANAGGADSPVLIYPLVLGVRNGPFNFSSPIYALDITTSVVGEALIEAV